MLFGTGNRSLVEEELHRLRAENKRLLMERDNWTFAKSGQTEFLDNLIARP